MDMFLEIHKEIPREGPGENQSTRKAFDRLKHLPQKAKILDIGCGPGMQTIELARKTDGIVCALDIHQPFLDRLEEAAQTEQVDHKIRVQPGSMFDLGEYYHEGEFDVIWSEGAIFIIGFEEGIRAWDPFIKDGGYMVISEISWLKKETPTEIQTYWEEDYPGIQSIDENVKIVKACGYELLDAFAISEAGWWEHYYNPLEKRINILRKRYKDSEKWQKRLDQTQKEIDMYRKYSEYYGYVFYVMKKADHPKQA